MTEGFEATGRFDIQVALKIIRHISSGIYRDRAGALRELISNSFDAQSRVVRIDTGFPSFDRMIVTDDGFGIDAQTFRKAFTQVGLSLKITNPDDYKSELKRPILGLFGIGFLAAAHISRDIWVTSFKRGSETGLKAHVNLKPYFLYQDKIETFDEFQFGTVEYGSVRRDALGPGEDKPFGRPHGTTIELRGVREGPFIDVLTREGERCISFPQRGFREKVPGSKMTELVEKCQRNPYVLYTDRLTGREQLAWNLGMSAPVRYLEGGPIRPGHVSPDTQQTLEQLRKFNEDLKFEVWLDGIEIRKPILLPTHRPGRRPVPDPDLPRDILVSTVAVDGKSSRGRRVRARGYLFYQPYRIVPAELRGLYPRMGGVGIGYTFENRFLSYLKAENPVLRVQVSGELYVEEGLGDALNLDRSGFMELSPEYEYLASEAGNQVTEFFQRARRTHSARATAEAHRALEIASRKAIEELTTFLKKRGLDFEVGLEEDAAERAFESDFVNNSIYELGRGAEAIVDYADHKVILTSSEPSDIWMAEFVLLVDSLLASNAKDPAKARREFAEELEALTSKLRGE